jgi:hypothetical protein
MGGLKLPPRRNWVLPTGQTTIYVVGDAGDAGLGLGKPTSNYLTSGSGTTTVNSPHYATNTISFDSATKTMTDSASGLITILTGDTIYVWNGLNNGRTFTVATGGIAGSIVFNEAPTTETAGNYITIYKQVAWNNQVTQDLKTGLMWTSYSTISPALKLGPTSNGLLCWYDATKTFVLHAAAADLQIISSSHILKIVGGAGEIGKFKVGMCLVFSGFASSANNVPGFWIVSVAVNGADLDIVIGSWGLLSGKSVLNTLVSESAGGSRSIKVICQCGFSLVSAANVSNLGGFSDWRLPNKFEIFNISDGQAPSSAPDATVFPGWSTASLYITSSIRTDDSSEAMFMNFGRGELVRTSKTSTYAVALVRG